MAAPSAWPGRIHTGTSRRRSPAATSTSSVDSTPSRSAVAGETSRALSQVSLVSGLGHSWSQALLAKRPSQRVGSGRKFSSSSAPPEPSREVLADEAISRAASAAWAIPAAETATARGGSAVPGTTPSWTARSQAASKPASPPPSPCRRQWSRTRS